MVSEYLKSKGDPPLHLVLRFILGAVFIYASVDKIIDPGEFAHSIYNYRLFPPFLIYPLALFLPFLECFAGLLLILGIYRRTMAQWLLVLLGLFSLALTINLARGMDINCGCFTQDGETGNLLGALLKNIALIGIGVFYLRRPQSPPYPRR